jgi:hypothetical protein
MMKVRWLPFPLLLLVFAALAAPAAAQTPTITPNSPYQVGLNAIVVQGDGGAAAVTTEIVGESGFQVDALWLLSGGLWTYYIPAFPALGTLTTFPPIANAFAILSTGAGTGFSMNEVNRLGIVLPNQVRIVDVRVGRHGSFDRVVFQFSSAIPPYRVAYVPEPVHACGSGFPVAVAGNAAIEARFDQIELFDNMGNALIPPGEFAPGFPSLMETKRICAFEGQATWALGIRDAQPFRVIELDNPPRVVVDVRHP